MVKKSGAQMYRTSASESVFQLWGVNYKEVLPRSFEGIYLAIVVMLLQWQR